MSRTPQGRFMQTRTMQERFEDKYIPEPNSGCWLWIGAFFLHGYGEFWERGRKYRAHRVAWKLYRGPIPAGIHVLHTCDTPACVNPDHLWLGKDKDNMADRHRKGKYARGSKHHNARLSEADVTRIREDTRTHRTIAADYGVSNSCIDHIKLRISWRHIP